jgi:hypothetical protein
MSDTQGFRINEKVITGGLLLLLGVLFILDNFHMIDAGSLWDYWPLFIIGPGLSRVLTPTRPGQRVGGFILIAIGSFLLLRNLGFLWVPFHKVWPFGLVALGLYVIWRAAAPRVPAAVTGSMGGPQASLGPGAPSGSGGPAVLSEFALFGGGHRIVQTADFRGGTVTVIAGGFDIDLRKTAIAGDSASVEIFTMMGGCVFRVPETWKVELNVTPLLGGIDMKAHMLPPAEGAPKILRINGFILMGGVEVKN